jgi:NAD(P)-dependent dehydrogenase (short-subunit alcohol dehydrogenase family)
MSEEHYPRPPKGGSEVKDPTRRVVVTGSSGIAAATASQLSAKGDALFIISIDPVSSKSLADSLRGGTGWFAANLEEELQAIDAFTAAEETLGKIDAVVAVAGGSARSQGDGWLHEMTFEAWQAALSLNLTSMFLTSREGVRRMRREGGSLVMTSSVLVSSPQPDNFTTHGYAAAKAAITGWTKSLASAYAPDGIRVNTVAPGLVRTSMTQRAEHDESIMSFAQRKQPLVRDLLSAEVVAEAMCWFVHCEGITGQVLSVDGGWEVTSTS